MLDQAGFRRATLEGVLFVAVLFPVHFIAGLPGPTFLSTLAILLLFFLPPIWGALRLRSPERPAPWRILYYAFFGFQLGLWAGVVGGMEKALLTVALGQRFIVPLPTWVIIAFIFALASAMAYADFVLIIRGLMTLAQDPRAPLDLFFPRQPRPEEASIKRAILYSLVPGMGHYYLGQLERGSRYLILTLTLALLGLLIGTAALVLLVEARVPSLWLMIVSGLLILSPLPLAILAALDVYTTSHRRVGEARA